MKKQKTILVTGATGRQGAAVCHHLLAAGLSVVALVRDAQSEAAMGLARRGAVLAEGTFEDGRALREAMDGVEGVFSMQNFWKVGYVGEFTQALNILEAAKDAGVADFVYTSAGADSGAGLPHIETKCCIEAMTMRYFPNATILRGVWFMDGFTGDFFDFDIGEFRFVTDPDQPHGWVSTADIGKFTTLAFEDREAYGGVSLNLASGFSTGNEMARAFGDALGRPMRYRRFESAELSRLVRGWFTDHARIREMDGVFRFIAETNFSTDPTLLRRLLPRPQALDEWVVEEWLPRHRQHQAAVFAPR